MRVKLGNLEDQGVDGSIILKRIFKGMKWKGVDVILSSQDRGMWWVFVPQVLDLWVP
jgi:hypothetical protein